MPLPPPGPARWHKRATARPRILLSWSLGGLDTYLGTCLECPAGLYAGLFPPTLPSSPQKPSGRFVISLWTWAVSGNRVSYTSSQLLLTTGGAQQRVMSTAVQLTGTLNNRKMPSGDWLSDLHTASDRQRG